MSCQSHRCSQYELKRVLCKIFLQISNYSHVPRQKRPQPGVPARCSKPPQRANRADFFIIIFGKKEVRRYYSKTTLHGPRGHIRTNLIGGNMVRGLSFYSEKSFSENSENLVFFSQIIESLLIIPDMFFMYGNVPLSSLVQYLKNK